MNVINARQAGLGLEAEVIIGCYRKQGDGVRACVRACKIKGVCRLVGWWAGCRWVVCGWLGREATGPTKRLAGRLKEQRR